MLSCLPTKHIFVEDQGHHSAQKKGRQWLLAANVLVVSNNAQ